MFSQLFVCHAIKIRHNNGLALVFLQPAKAGCERRRGVAVVYRVFPWTEHKVFNRLVPLDRLTGATLFCTQAVDHAVPQDGGCPGRGRPAAGLKLSRLSPDQNERFLQYVVSQRTVGQHAQRDGIEPRGDELIEPGKRLPVTSPRRKQNIFELTVRGAFHSSCHAVAISPN